MASPIRDIIVLGTHKGRPYNENIAPAYRRGKIRFSDDQISQRAMVRLPIAAAITKEVASLLPQTSAHRAPGRNRMAAVGVGAIPVAGAAAGAGDRKRFCCGNP